MSLVNQVAKDQKNVPSGAVVPNPPVNNRMEFDACDIELPRVQVMQGISQKVMDGEAKFGELRSSLDNELLGDVGKPMEFIPFGKYEVYHVTEGEQLTDIIPATSHLKNTKGTYYVEGNYTYRLVRNFYVIIPGKPLPFIISFKKTSSRAGKSLSTHITTNQMMGIKDYAFTYKLAPRKEKNDKGTFIKLEIFKGKATKEKDIQQVLKWLPLTQQKRVESTDNYNMDNDI